MLKQFLLNRDGSIPADVDVALLNAEGIRLVLPTDAPQDFEMIAVEQEPQQDENGVWRQVWALKPIPTLPT
jgi:hypothetical protein